MKKIFPWICCAVLVCVAAGCARPEKPSNEITIWHWMTDRQETLEALAGKYADETGIAVKLELFAPSDAYSQKVIAAAQAGVLPDIYGILDKKSVFAAFIKAGYAADLTSSLEADGRAWERVFFPKAVDVNRFPPGNADGVKPGIYGVPIDMTKVQLVYNRGLLRKAGIRTPPETFGKFLADISALRRVGITPFVSGFGELWMIECFASNYAFHTMGEEKIMATFRGDVPYTDPGWVQVFGLFRTLADNGAFMEGIVTKGNKFAEQDFVLGRAAFAFNGSWCVNVYRKMNPDLDYGTIPLPVLDPDRPMISWAGAGSSFVVNKASPNRDKAVDFLKWLTAREQQVFLSEETNSIPANRRALASFPRVLADFASDMDNTTHPGIWPVHEDALVLEAFDKGIQAIIIGERTPEEVAVDVQKVKNRQMAKRKRRGAR